MEVIVQDANNIVIEVDQGRQGRGISTVGLVTVGADYYLLFTFTDGSTEQVGPIAPIVTEVLFAEARNAEATTILKGQPVYLYQAQGNLATVKLAFNTSDATSAKTLGLAAENIAPGAQGLITCQGTLGGLNTSAYSEGDTLYLGATAGTLTNVKPQAPNHLVYIGVVERANNGAGQIYVRVQNGYELDEIHDVLITNPVNGNTLIYDAATNLWKNAGITPGTGISVTNGPASITVGNTGVLSFSGGTTGLTPATATTGAVTLAGTLATTNGGTGLTSFNANRIFYSSSTSAIGLSANLTFDGSTLTNTGAVKFGNGAATNTSRLMINNATNTATGIQLFQDGIESWIMGMPANSAGLAWSASGNEQMRLTTTGLGIGTSSPTNKLSVDGNANITGNVTLGDASTDIVQVNGYMGVGGAATVVDNAIHVKNTQLAGAAQTGVVSEITATSASTVAIQGFRSNVATAASAFTVADVSGFRMLNSTKGAGSTITNQHGVNIADLTSGTNNFGITSLVSSGTNKWNIYASGTAQNYFAGKVSVGYTGGSESLNVANGGLLIDGNISTTNTTALALGRMNTTYSSDNRAFIGWKDTGGTIGGLAGSLILQARSSVAANIALATGTPTAIERLTIGTTEAVFNDPGNDYDFRVESDTNTHALFVRGSDGFVGIGTNAPGTKLQIEESNTGAASELLTVYNSGVNSGTEARIKLAGGNGLSNRYAYISAINNGAAAGNGHSLVFATNANSAAPTERLRIDSSGNVGIGTSSPSFASGGGIAIYRVGDARITLKNNVTGDGSITGAGLVYSGVDLTVNNQEAGYIRFTTTATERLRIDSVGNVGIGTNAPTTRFDVSAAHTSGVGNVARFYASGTLAGGLGVLVDPTTLTAALGTLGNDSSLAFRTNAGGTASERLRITSDGYLRMASGTGGIQFNGETAAANALDDYEEGTFTPTIIGTTTAGTGTYTAQLGRYTKIGNVINFYVFVAWSAHTGTGDLLVSSLPFTSANVSNLSPILNVTSSSLTFSNQLYAAINLNATTAAIRTFSTNAATAAVAMDTAATLIITGFYYV